MHEMSLLSDLMRKITTVAQVHGAKKVTSVTISIGALCHLSAVHLRTHFAQAARGTVAEEARLQIEVLTDIHEPNAQELMLESVEVETRSEDD